MKASVHLLTLLAWCACCAYGATSDLQEPRTLEELNRWYLQVPAEQNAALYFLKGAEPFRTNLVRAKDLPWLSEAALPKLNAPVPAPMARAMAEFVRTNQAVLSNFSKAAELKASRYPIDFIQGPETLLPHLAPLKVAGRFLAVCSLSEAVAGHGTEAAEALRLNLAATKSLEPEPLFISQMVRDAMSVTVVDALEQTLNRIRLGSEQLKKLDQELGVIVATNATGKPFWRSIVGERITSMAMCDMPVEKLFQLFNEFELLPRVYLTNCRAKYSATADKEFTDETFRLILSHWGKPYPRRLKLTTAACTKRENLASNSCCIVGMSVSAVGPALKKEAHCLRVLRMALTAVALERFRLDHHNKYPDNIAELNPKYLAETPTDPADDNPLSYYTQGSGYVLRSRKLNLLPTGKHQPLERTSFRVIEPP